METSELLATIAKLLVKVEELTEKVGELTCEVRASRDSDVTLRGIRAGAAARQAKSRAAKKGCDVTVTLPPQVVKASKLDLDLIKPVASRHGHVTEAGDHRKLIEYGVAAFEKASGAKYPFSSSDPKHVKDLLKNHGVAGSQRLVDLACSRYAADAFQSRRGLSFKLVWTDAAALVTAKTTGPPKNGASHLQLSPKLATEASGRKVL